MDIYSADITQPFGNAACPEACFSLDHNGGAARIDGLGKAWYSALKCGLAGCFPRLDLMGSRFLLLCAAAVKADEGQKKRPSS